MSENWEAHIQFRPDRLGHALYLVQKTGSSREYLVDGGAEVITIAPDTLAQPEKDPVFAWLHDEQLFALAKALAENGVKTPDTHLLEGKLQATQTHLEDMRKITGKKLGVDL